MHQHACFAAASARQHQQVTGGGAYGVALGVVEVIENVGNVHADILPEVGASRQQIGAVYAHIYAGSEPGQESQIIDFNVLCYNYNSGVRNGWYWM